MNKIWIQTISSVHSVRWNTISKMNRKIKRRKNWDVLWPGPALKARIPLVHGYLQAKIKFWASSRRQIILIRGFLTGSRRRNHQRLIQRSIVEAFSVPWGVNGMPSLQVVKHFASHYAFSCFPADGNRSSSDYEHGYWEVFRKAREHVLWRTWLSTSPMEWSPFLQGGPPHSKLQWWFMRLCF